MSALRLLIAVLACAGAVSGCSAGTQTQATTGGGTTTQAAAGIGTDTASSRPAPDYGAQAVRAVKHYYRAVDAGDFSGAWAELTSSVQAQLGGYSEWKSGFGMSVSTRVTSAVALDASSSSADVAVRLRSVDVDACGSNVTQHFHGAWRLRRAGGRWIAQRILMRKTSGATPVSDVSACPGANSDSSDVCDPTSAAYDAVTCDAQSGGSDSGDPCDPNSTAYDEANCYGGSSDQSFCDTHDCIDNFDNGTGYIVECNDGEWSHSGGRSGACSYHGGESDVTSP